MRRTRRNKTTIAPLPKVPKCPTCEHAVFDETYGEYKCKIREHTIYDLKESASCLQYKQKE